MKINQTVKYKVSTILSDAKVLLRLTLDSLIESIRNDPEKYSPLIYYNDMSSITTVDYPASDNYVGQQQQYLSSQDHYYIEYYTVMLVQEAEKLYNKLVKELTNRIVCDMAFNNNNRTSSSLLSSSTLKSNL